MMKKISALVASTLLTLLGAQPASGGSSTLDTSGSGWDLFNISNEVSLTYSGSIIEGQTYNVLASGTACLTGSGAAEMVILDNSNMNSGNSIGDIHSTGPFNIASSPLTAGAAGTSATFLVTVTCDSWSINQDPNRSRFLRLTFEAPIGSPANFMVTPQAGGSVFATWGVASGATSYTIQTAPGGGTCTTSQNFCTISGLTDATTYTFSLTATNGTQYSSIGSGPILYREPIDVKASVDSPNWKVGETVTAN